MEINKKEATANDYLANERTFLSWIRTGIGIMAFGFVVVKFSLFIKQLYALLGKSQIQIDHDINDYSGIVGIVIVGAGALIPLVSYFSYKATINKLNNGSYNYSSFMITVLSLFIFVVSVLMIYYLIKTT